MVRVLKLATSDSVKRAKRNNQLFLCEAPNCQVSETITQQWGKPARKKVFIFTDPLIHKEIGFVAVVDPLSIQSSSIHCKILL